MQHFNLPLESYSPWSPCTINYGLKLRNEMCDHSIYILYSLSSKDSQRTLPKSSVRPVVTLSHAPKLFLRGLNSINPAKTVKKFLGTERFSQISRIPRAKRVTFKLDSSRDFRQRVWIIKVLLLLFYFILFYNLTFQIFKFSRSLYYCGSIKYK